MRPLIAIAICGLVAAATGCQNNQPYVSVSNEQRSASNAWTVNDLYEQQIHGAIIRQHTVYPYHFISQSADLNDLGQRDLEVLAEHFKDHPGHLNIRRGRTSDDLYGDRVATVLAALSEAGVDNESMRIADAMAGGDGMDNQEVLLILYAPGDQGGSAPNGGTIRRNTPVSDPSGR